MASPRSSPPVTAYLLFWDSWVCTWCLASWGSSCSGGGGSAARWRSTNQCPISNQRQRPVDGGQSKHGEPLVLDRRSDGHDLCRARRIRSGCRRNLSDGGED